MDIAVSAHPPLPPGFTLDQPGQQDLPPLPPGFKLDSTDQAAPRDPSAPPLLPGEAGFDNTPSKEPSMLDRAARYGGEYLSGLKQAGQQLLQSPPSLQGAAEAFGTMATGALAGGVGAVRSKITGEPYEQAAEASIYQPRSASGKAMLGAVGAAAKPVTDLAGATGADVALLPLAGEMQALRAGQRFAKDASGFKTAAQQAERQRPPAPTTAEIGTSAKEAYARAKEAGAVAAPEGYARMTTGLRTSLREQGFNPKLHPKAAAVVEEIENTGGKPVAFDELEILRRQALAAERSIEADERRVAGLIIDRLDDYGDALASGAEPVMGGNAPAAVAARKEARGLYARNRKATEIEELSERAGIRAGQFSGSGYENALRTEFRQLALNKKRMGRFTQEEQQSIKLVAMGGKLDNALRYLGKLAPTGGLMQSLSLMGTGAGFAFGGPLGAIAAPAVGAVGALSRMGGTKRTIGNARRAEELMRRGPQRKAPEVEAVASPIAAPAGNRIAQLAPAPVKAPPAAPGYVPPESELQMARMGAQQTRPDVVAEFGAGELSQPIRASDVQIAPSKRAGFFDVVVDGKPITSVKGEAAAQELADGLIAEDIFANERAAAAEAARGGYAIEESPGENIVMETRPRQAARSATATKTQRLAGEETYKGFEIGIQADGTVYARKGAKWFLSATVEGVKALIDVPRNRIARLAGGE